MHTPKYTHKNTHTYTHRTHTQTHTQTHTHNTHTHKHIHTHTHTHNLMLYSLSSSRSPIPNVARPKAWVRAARLLGLRVRIAPGARMSVSCECCVLSGRGVCNGPIPRPEEYYRVECVDIEASTVRRPRPTRGCPAMKQKVVPCRITCFKYNQLLLTF